MSSKATVWSEATKRLTHMINGGDPHEGVLEESLVGHPLEDWARAVSEAANTELSLVLPIALVLPSACAQGGVWLDFPLAHGARLRNPITLQYVGLAGSGVGKTTLLGHARDVMTPALHAGGEVMRDWVVAKNIEGEGLLAAPPMGGYLWNADAWRKCHGAAACRGTLIGSATQEALRNGLAKNGSHQVAFTAEADLLEEIGRYSKDGGSVSMMLHGWDGEDIIVQRAKNDTDIIATRASLPMVVLMQPSAFETATSGQMFLDRGLLHRWLITGGGQLSDEATPWTSAQILAAHDPTTAMTAPLWVARGRLTEAMSDLARSTAEYRAVMAAHANWLRGGYDLVGIPEPVVPGLRMLGPADAAAVDAYLRVQQIRETLMRLAAGMADDPDNTDAVFYPLAARFTTHVLRVAAAYTLAMDPMATGLGAAEITDAATRVVPWLWGQWRDAVQKRNAASAVVAFEAAVKSNPKLRDLTPGGTVLSALGRMYRDRGVVMSVAAAEPGPVIEENGSHCSTRRGIHLKTRSTSRSMRQNWRSEDTQKGLDDLIDRGYVEIAGSSPSGSPYYRLTVSGMRAAAGELKG